MFMQDIHLEFIVSNSGRRNMRGIVMLEMPSLVAFPDLECECIPSNITRRIIPLGLKTPLLFGSIGINKSLVGDICSPLASISYYHNGVIYAANNE
jgi:hypothetical protein